MTNNQNVCPIHGYYGNSPGCSECWRDSHATVNGWTFDPSGETWTLRVDDTRWISLYDTYEHAPSVEFTAKLIALLKEGA